MHYYFYVISTTTTNTTTATIIIIIIIANKQTNLTNYKPDSKKVGTLYKLWIKKECNNLQIS